MDKLKWCFDVKKGLKRTDSNTELAVSYLNQAERTLSKINELIEEGDFVWASVRIYYCAYYSLYSFLQKIGFKSENHDCSIELARQLIGKDWLNNIEQFKENRVDAQYYLKTGQKEKLSESYLFVKHFYLQFKEIVSNLSEEDIEDYNNKIERLLDEK